MWDETTAVMAWAHVMTFSNRASDLSLHYRPIDQPINQNSSRNPKMF